MAKKTFFGSKTSAKAKTKTTSMDTTQDEDKSMATMDKTQTLEDSNENSPINVQTPSAQKGIQFDDSEIITSYANFCQVSSTPEEVILDLGISPDPFGSGDVTIPVSQRLVLTHFTTKRLIDTLKATIHRHEQAFGIVDTNIYRRAQNRR